MLFFYESLRSCPQSKMSPRILDFWREMRLMRTEDWFAVISALIQEVDLDGSSEQHLCHCLHRGETCIGEPILFSLRREFTWS